MPKIQTMMVALLSAASAALAVKSRQPVPGALDIYMEPVGMENMLNTIGQLLLDSTLSNYTFNLDMKSDSFFFGYELNSLHFTAFDIQTELFDFEDTKPDSLLQRAFKDMNVTIEIDGGLKLLGGFIPITFESVQFGLLGLELDA
jgi:hypothetical protein